MAAGRFTPAGEGTGLGSLPFHDPGEALALIEETFPYLPHWPQLPRRSATEGFAPQYLGALLQLGLLTVTGEGALRLDPQAPEWPERLTGFYDLYLRAGEGDAEALAAFGFTPEAAAGFFAFLDRCRSGGFARAARVKGQASGPITVGFQITDPTRRAVFYDDQLRDLLVKNSEMHLVWQARALGATGRPVVLFVDEPGLYLYGQSVAVGLGREPIVDSLAVLCEAVHREGALAGTHCCAGTDWSLLLRSDVDIISFDAHDYFTSLLPYVEDVGPFLERGGVLAWGIVPNSAKVEAEDAESLHALLDEEMEALARKGVPHALLRSQCLITPSCGTGTLEPELARRVHRLAAEVSERFRSRG